MRHIELLAGISDRGVEFDEQLHGQEPGTRATKSADEVRNEATAEGICRQV